MNWKNIRVYNNSQHNASEELVCQLARQEKTSGYKRFVRNGTPVKIANLEGEMLKASRDFVKLGELTVQKEEAEKLLEEKKDRWMRRISLIVHILFCSYCRGYRCNYCNNDSQKYNE